MKFARIPVILRNIYPKITWDLYCSLIKEERFLSNETSICTNCFMSFSKVLKTISGANHKTSKPNEIEIKKHIKKPT